MPKAHLVTVVTPSQFEKQGDKYTICGHCLGDGESAKGCSVTVVDVENGFECEVCGFVIEDLH